MCIWKVWWEKYFLYFKRERIDAISQDFLLLEILLSDKGGKKKKGKIAEEAICKAGEQFTWKFQFQL